MVLTIAVIAALGASASAGAATASKPFPRGFLWGTASAGFQNEMGASPAHVDRGSDYWQFMTDRSLVAAGTITGARPDRGPGFWSRWRSDLDLARGLGSNAIRVGIEWSRIFPRSTASVRVGTRFSRAELRRLDRLADRRALAHYRAVVRGARARGMRVMLSLNHYTMPLWVHDPRAVRRAFAGVEASAPMPRLPRAAGWLRRSTADEFGKYAAYVAWKLGDDVALFATLNEPLVQVQAGYVTLPGQHIGKPPGITSFPAAVTAILNLARGNAAAYDAVKSVDRRARVGIVHNITPMRPADPARAADVRGARHANQLAGRTILDAVVRGIYDADADGVVDPGERKRSLAGKADFIGVNHYSVGRTVGLDAPLTPSVPLLDFVPTVGYRTAADPAAPPCPAGATCGNDVFGWHLDPTGFREAIRLAGSYRLPMYITENGIDDADDDQRPAYLRAYLGVLQREIARGADVRGYFGWTLTDNFEWAAGYGPKFGFYAVRRPSLRRVPRRASVALFRRITRANALPVGGGAARR